MARSAFLISLFCLQSFGLFSVASAGGDTMCGKLRSGQYANEQVCTNILRFPDGKPAPETMLDTIPEAYPWLFPFSETAAAPQQTLRVTGAEGGFSTLQFINGWAPYDTSGAEATQFQKFSRVRDILIETGSGHSLRQTLKDTGESQFIALPGPVAEEWVSIKVLSVYEGERDLVALRWFSVAWEADLQ
jgi:hypothetical protein